MSPRTRKLQLIWNVNKFRCRINDVDIAIAPHQFPPFAVDAHVEEQDTALVLGETDILHQSIDKPIWYLNHKLESQPLLTPGQVIVRDTQPLRLQAILHDLDSEPSCSELWIFQVIQQVFDTAETRHIRAVQMPILGTRYSQITPGQFYSILIEIINRKRPAPIDKIWLVTSEQYCESLFQQLQSQLNLGN